MLIKGPKYNGPGIDNRERPWHNVIDGIPENYKTRPIWSNLRVSEIFYQFLQSSNKMACNKAIIIMSDADSFPMKRVAKQSQKKAASS